MRFLSVAVGCSLLGLAAPAAAVTLGQTDTFEDGTTQGWTVNLLGMGVHPAPPANVMTGGPGGAGDNFLQLTSFGGGGAGSRMTVINLAQWSGDYIAEGVNAIRMWVNNTGANDLALRLYFEDPMGGPPTNAAFSTDAVLVAAGGGWQNIVFGVRPGDLTAHLGSVNAALSGTTALRLYHSTLPGFPGEPVVAQLGVDNISARAAIPEPATWAMLLLGFGAAGLALRARPGRVSYG